jgi:hypothetical protein
MRLRTAKNDFRPEIIMSGVIGGGLAGVLASCLVHTTLELCFGFRDALAKQIVGLILGLAAARLLGLLGGVTWNLALSRKHERARARPTPRANPKSPIGTAGP